MIEDLATHMTDVAQRLLGEPNRALSTRDNWRYGRKGSLSVDVKRGRWFDHETGASGGVLALIQRETGGDVRAAFDFIGSDYAPSERRIRKSFVHERQDKAQQEDRARKIARALTLWDEAAPAIGTIAATYLSSRRLWVPPDDVIRFHPACPFGGGAVHPCMVALFRDVVTGEPCGIHRTALTPEGQKIGKKMLGRSGGAAIMLTLREEAETGLGIAEGIETALSVIVMGWRPVWAVGSAGCIAKFPLLDGVGALTVFADSDDVGLNAARTAASRYADDCRFAYVQRPDAGDFNDVLMEKPEW